MVIMIFLLFLFGYPDRHASFFFNVSRGAKITNGDIKRSRRKQLRLN